MRTFGKIRGTRNHGRVVLIILCLILFCYPNIIITLTYMRLSEINLLKDSG